jgi:hypothetical protein
MEGGDLVDEGWCAVLVFFYAVGLSERKVEVVFAGGVRFV